MTVRERPSIDVKVKCKTSGEEKELTKGGCLTRNDTYAIELTPRTSAYVYIYHLDTRGNATPLYPSAQFARSVNPVEPGRLYRVPHFGRWLCLDESRGTEQIVVVAKKGEVKDPLKLCMAALEDGNEMLASSGRIQKAVGKERAATRSLQGIRPDRPVAESKSPNPEKQPPPAPPADEAKIDMKTIFVWKLPFEHL